MEERGIEVPMECFDHEGLGAIGVCKSCMRGPCRECARASVAMVASQTSGARARRSILLPSTSGRRE